MAVSLLFRFPSTTPRTCTPLVFRENPHAGPMILASHNSWFGFSKTDHSGSWILNRTVEKCSLYLRKASSLTI